MGGCGGAVKGGTSLVLGQEVGIELRWLQHNQVQRSAAMSGHPRALVCGILNEDTSHELTCSHVGQMSARDTYSVSALARY